MNMLKSAEALVLGVVEGLTEFLPVSSTGHLILTSHFLGLEHSEAVKAFEIIIQSGAIAAVIVYNFKEISELTLGLLKLEKSSLQKLLVLFLAFLPSGLLALIFGSWIKAHLFSVNTVAWALLIGGLVMLFVERKWKHPQAHRPQVDSKNHVLDISLKKAFTIGIFQCFALWPGMSRSMTSIFGARLIGMNAQNAARFSFWLALPTLIGASIYDFIKNHQTLMSTENFLLNLSMGWISSFVVALVVIKVFINFLSTRTLEVFAWYRIILSLCLWFFFFS